MNAMKNLIRATNSGHKYLFKRNIHGTTCRLKFLDCAPNAQLSKTVADRYMCLPVPEAKAQVSYVWIDGTGIDLRTRSRTLDFVPSTYKDCPNWSFDGSSAFFGSANKSDYYIVPIAMYADPFRRGHHKIVLCETFTPEKKPTKTNRRQSCIEKLNKVCDQEVMFGFEQDFFFMGPEGRPFGWPCMAIPKQVGKNYAGICAHRVLGREITESIYRCCMYAGVDVYGTTAQRAYAQWKLLTGPTMSIKAADDLWMVRFIIQRVSEEFGISASFRPTIMKGIFPSSLHTNISTKVTREDDGLKCIQEYIKKLECTHKLDQKYFDCKEGDHLKERLTGEFNTCKIDKFTSGVGDRSVCVRIPNSVADKKKGFFEDRRPSSCADPYNVITAFVNTCLM